MYFYGQRNKSGVVNVVGTLDRVIVWELLWLRRWPVESKTVTYLFQHGRYIVPLTFMYIVYLSTVHLDANYDARNYHHKIIVF